MKRKVRWFLLLFASLAVFSIATAQYEPLSVMGLDRWIFSGGESTRMSGVLTINATSGQPVAAQSNAAPLTLYGGYWGPAYYDLYLPYVQR